MRSASQGWLILTVIDLKSDVAVVKAMQHQPNNIAEK